VLNSARHSANAVPSVPAVVPALFSIEQPAADWAGVRSAIVEGISALRSHDPWSAAVAELDHFRRLLSQVPEEAIRDHTLPGSLVMTRPHWHRLAGASDRAAAMLSDRVAGLTPASAHFRGTLERAVRQLRAFAAEINIAIRAPNTVTWRIRRGVHPNDSEP
jgi:hypothetical protein